MIGERGDGWRADDAQIRALGEKLESFLVNEHQATASAAMIFVLAKVVIKNGHSPEDIVGGHEAVCDQLAMTIRRLRAH